MIYNEKPFEKITTSYPACLYYIQVIRRPVNEGASG